MAYTLVQSASSFSGGGGDTDESATLGSSPTTGNLLVIVGGGRMDDGTVSAFTCNGSGSQAMTLVADVTGSMEAHAFQCWYRIIQSGDPTTWHVGSSEGARLVISVAEYDLTDAVLDGNNFGGSGATNVTTRTTNSTGTLSSADGLVVVWGTSRTASAGLSVSGTYANVLGNTDCGNYNVIVKWAELSATTAINETVTESTGSSRMGAGVAAFVKSAGGGSKSLTPGRRRVFDHLVRR